MVNFNKVILAGNLTRDPEIRYTKSGKAVADLNLAINRRYKTASGDYKEDPCFVNIVVWERQAELTGEYLRKGSSILVEGSLRLDTWESNGEKRSRLRVTADRIQFLDRLKKADSGDVPEDGHAKKDNADTATDAGTSQPDYEIKKADSGDVPEDGHAKKDNADTVTDAGTSQPDDEKDDADNLPF